MTQEGVEFLGYARQVIQEMELLEDRFIENKPQKQHFCVSTQHYTFTANAFVEMVQKFSQDRFEFILNETQTHQILEDVKNRFCDLGIIYLCDRNETFLRKMMDEMDLVFTELFHVAPHVFLRAEHPLAKEKSISLKDLKPYPRLNFLQGSYESADYSEEPFSTALTALIGAELFIATLGSFATMTWIGMGILIRKFYMRHFRGGADDSLDPLNLCNFCNRPVSLSPQDTDNM